MPPRLSAWLDRASAALCDFGGWLLALMALLINVEVFARYVLNRSTLIADEYAGYMFVWMTLFGFAHALRSGQFLRVEALVMRFGPRGRAMCDLLAALVGLGVATIATWSASLLFLSSWRFGTVSIQPSATPLWMAQIAVPLGLAWLVLLYLDLLVQTFRRREAKR